jgi:putative GTP pyrophosphokinase
VTREMEIDTFKSFEYGVFRKEYNERKPIFEKAVSEALKSIAEIKHKHQKKATLRVAYIDGRVKSLTSIIRKACEKDIPAEDVFEKIDDIVGLRVVVNNLKDIEPLIEELKTHPKFRIVEREEHGENDPYRAVHLKVIYRLSDDAAESKVTCEIQIRTLLQDGWAILSHHDLYKNEAELPELARPISKHLSEALQTLDRLANDLREHLEAKVEPPNDLTDEAPLDKQGIAFLYYELLGQKPQEYEVEFLVKKAGEYGLKTIGEARKGLSEEVLDHLKEIHDSRFPMLSPGRDFLEFGMLFAAEGPRAFEEYRNRIEVDWDEIESIGRAEALSGMPETFEEFVEMVESGGVPWEALKELGGVQECENCGVEIFVPDAAAEGILDHYGFPDTELDLEGLLFGACDRIDCPFEQESVNTSGLCPWCDHMMSKDD